MVQYATHIHRSEDLNLLAEAKSMGIGISAVASSILMAQATTIGDSALGQWGSLAAVVGILLYFNKQASEREARMEARAKDAADKFEKLIERSVEAHMDHTGAIRELIEAVRGKGGSHV